MKRVIALVSVIVIVGGGILAKVTVFKPSAVISRLHRSSKMLAMQGNRLYLDGDRRGALKKYQGAYGKLEALLERTEDEDLVESATPLKDSCERGIRAIESPEGTVESMMEALEIEEGPHGEEYVKYWDFHALAAESFGKEWKDLEEEEKDWFASYFARYTTGFLNLMKTVVPIIEPVLDGAEIQGNEAVVSSYWDLMGQKAHVPFYMIKVGDVWRIYDFHMSYLGLRLTVFLDVGFQYSLRGRTAKDFASSGDPEKLAKSSLSGLTSLLYEDSSKAEEIFVTTREADVYRQDDVIQVLPKGALVTKIVEARTASEEKIVLVSCDVRGERVAVWISAKSISPVLE